MESLLKNIKCKCGRSMSEEEFYRHFQNCQDFKTTFRQFDSQFGQLLQSYSEPKENLVIIRLLLKQYITVLEKKISNYLKSKGISEPLYSNNSMPNHPPMNPIQPNIQKMYTNNPPNNMYPPNLPVNPMNPQPQPQVNNIFDLPNKNVPLFQQPQDRKSVV